MQRSSGIKHLYWLQFNRRVLSFSPHSLSCLSHACVTKLANPLIMLSALNLEKELGGASSVYDYVMKIFMSAAHLCPL